MKAVCDSCLAAVSIKLFCKTYKSEGVASWALKRFLKTSEFSCFEPSETFIIRKHEISFRHSTHRITHEVEYGCASARNECFMHIVNAVFCIVSALTANIPHRLSSRIS